MLPESSLVKDWCHICRAMLTISSEVIFPLCLTFFLLLSVLQQFSEGFDDQGRGRRHCLNMGLSVLSGQFHHNPQTLATLAALVMSSPTCFWRQAQGADLGGQSRHGTSAPRVHDSDLLGVELWGHRGGGWRMNPDSG